VCLRAASVGGTESIILSAGGTESMMLSAHAESMILSGRADSIIVSAPLAESMILSVLFGHLISYYANSSSYKNKTNWQL
jgi:hypothetical protein